MNEELKIIITAVTSTAKKKIDEIKKKVADTEKEGKKLGATLKKIGVVVAGVVAAIGAVVGALIALGKNTREYREQQAKLNTAFEAAGATAKQAQVAYNGLFRFMGDSDTATEAAAHLAKLTTNEQHLAEWTTALQGIYATFGKSLPIEGLTEAANETAKVGQVTGVLADALNWAGVSEDAFNAQLAECNSEAEREALIRNTLNGLYSDAAQLYERNNADIIAANEAQARLDATTARLGKTIQPLLTAVTNMGAVLLEALAPAINVVVGALTWLINAISKAVAWISALFGAFSGKGAANDIATNIGGAGVGAGKLQTNLEGAADAAKELKKQTMGFDELNKLQSQDSGGSGSGAGAGGGAVGGGFALDTSGINSTLDNTSAKFTEFVEKLKTKWEWLGNIFNDIKTNIITPAITSVKKVAEDMLNGIKKAWDKSGGELTKNIETFFNGVKEDITEFYEEVVKPIWEKLLIVFDDVWVNGLKPLWDEITLAFVEIGACILQFYNEFVKPIVDKIQDVVYPIIVNVVGWIAEKVGDAIIVISGVIAGVIEVIKGVIQFLTGVFTGDWQKAWEGVKSIFSGVWKSFVAIAKEPLNEVIGFVNKAIKVIVDGANKIIRGINKISVTIPDMFGGGTIGFNLKELSAPSIPKLATGGIVTGDTLAHIGEGGKKEAVLPLEQNTGWMDILADKIASRNGAPSRIVLMLDGKELGYAAINGINGITQQTGALQLKLY